MILMAVGSLMWFIVDRGAAAFREQAPASGMTKPAEAAFAVVSVSFSPTGLIGMMIVAMFSATTSSMDAGLDGTPRLRAGHPSADPPRIRYFATSANRPKPNVGRSFTVGVRADRHSGSRSALPMKGSGSSNSSSALVRSHRLDVDPLLLCSSSGASRVGRDRVLWRRRRSVAPRAVADAVELAARRSGRRRRRRRLPFFGLFWSRATLVIGRRLRNSSSLCTASSISPPNWRGRRSHAARHPRPVFAGDRCLRRAPAVVLNDLRGDFAFSPLWLFATVVSPCCGPRTTCP